MLVRGPIKKVKSILFPVVGSTSEQRVKFLDVLYLLAKYRVPDSCLRIEELDRRIKAINLAVCIISAKKIERVWNNYRDENKEYFEKKRNEQKVLLAKTIGMNIDEDSILSPNLNDDSLNFEDALAQQKSGKIRLKKVPVPNPFGPSKAFSKFAVSHSTTAKPPPIEKKTDPQNTPTKSPPAFPSISNTSPPPAFPSLKNSPKFNISIKPTGNQSPSKTPSQIQVQSGQSTPST
eukprot:CAMPEP_0117418904 /NCGR_PEP_ID=MMETSP0758-20121206/587_1 /TAXON_ID=63605 /ORGANISM="Percolomonas cosmopolitus, Strain AE-1 (ATCC 50343)" /LENGTH=233 /DNA_ID=CAMNT_0005199677 /DNA_START=2411 /DNA_END=3109 /DNA_ORIENTATION=+